MDRFLAQVKHNEAITNLMYLLASNDRESNINVLELGEKLLFLGLDLITDGFWLWDIATDIEYYSPKFRDSLGFKNELDFPSVAKSWQDAIFPSDAKVALESFNKHFSDPKSPYYVDVRYNKKEGGVVRLICAGTIVNRDNPKRLLMLGTHRILEK